MYVILTSKDACEDSASVYSHRSSDATKDTDYNKV